MPGDEGVLNPGVQVDAGPGTASKEAGIDQRFGGPVLDPESRALAQAGSPPKVEQGANSLEAGINNHSGGPPPDAAPQPGTSSDVEPGAQLHPDPEAKRGAASMAHPGSPPDRDGGAPQPGAKSAAHAQGAEPAVEGAPADQPDPKPGIAPSRSAEVRRSPRIYRLARLRSPGAAPSPDHSAVADSGPTPPALAPHARKIVPGADSANAYSPDVDSASEYAPSVRPPNVAPVGGEVAAPDPVKTDDPHRAAAHQAPIGLPSSSVSASDASHLTEEGHLLAEQHSMPEHGGQPEPLATDGRRRVDSPATWAQANDEDRAPTTRPQTRGAHHSGAVAGDPAQTPPDRPQNPHAALPTHAAGAKPSQAISSTPGAHDITLATDANAPQQRPFRTYRLARFRGRPSQYRAPAPQSDPQGAEPGAPQDQATLAESRPAPRLRGQRVTRDQPDPPGAQTDSHIRPLHAISSLGPEVGHRTPLQSAGRDHTKQDVVAEPQVTAERDLLVGTPPDSEQSQSRMREGPRFQADAPFTRAEPTDDNKPPHRTANQPVPGPGAIAGGAAVHSPKKPHGTDPRSAQSAPSSQAAGAQPPQAKAPSTHRRPASTYRLARFVGKAVGDVARGAGPTGSGGTGAPQDQEAHLPPAASRPSPLHQGAPQAASGAPGPPAPTAGDPPPVRHQPHNVVPASATGPAPERSDAAGADQPHEADLLPAAPDSSRPSGPEGAVPRHGIRTYKVAGPPTHVRTSQQRIGSAGLAPDQSPRGGRPKGRRHLRRTLMPAPPSDPAPQRRLLASTIQRRKASGAPTAHPSLAPLLADGVPTQIGGLLYLINVMLHLDLPNSFEPTWRLASQVGPWGALDMLGRGLLAETQHRYRDDAIWAALAMLDGREPPEPPGHRHFRGRALPFRLPPNWLSLLPPAASLHWAAQAGRLRTWTDSGILLTETARTHGAPNRQALDELRPYHLEAIPTLAPIPTVPPLGGPLLTGCLPELIRWTALVLPFLRGYLSTALGTNADPLSDLLQAPGTLYVTSSHVDLVLDLNAISLPVRMAGLDRNPGWLAQFGRVIYFHFT